MHGENRILQSTRFKLISGMASSFCIATTLALISAPALAQQTGQKTFQSAGQASQALIAALKKQDEPALLEILGSDAKQILDSGDAVEDKNNREEFVQKYEQMHRLVVEPDGDTTLYIGAENWPTPIPLKKANGAWFFDTPAGKTEILYRRIGKNEMSAMQVCRELVDAEKEYYGQPHDGDGGSQYAQKFYSDPGKHNGLYWETSGSEGSSPIGPLVASASAQGYPMSEKSEPFQGYYFRILTGEKNSGHAQSYLIDGKMTKGFAILAFPAEYRSTGVMTFVVDQDGAVYEKDLGRRTAQISKSMTQYAHDASWRKAD